MVASYSQLQEYRSCPRKFGFSQLGYRSPTILEPLQTGTLVHAGLAAYFKGQDVERMIREQSYTVQVPEGYPVNHPSEFREMQVTLEYSVKRAMELTTRYISHWAKDYKVALVEPVMELGGVICHPDLIAYYGTPVEKRVIADYKTSYHPDERWYDISNQTDLYAYVLLSILQLEDFPAEWTEWLAFRGGIDLIIYDIISEEGIYRHIRPPRLTAGEQIFRSIQRLNKLITDVKTTAPEGMMYEELWLRSQFLDDPHPDYTCPSRCNFFHPCWLLDTDSWEACRDFLEGNYLK